MYETIISLENLFDAWTEFRKGKGGRRDVAQTELCLEDVVFDLHDELRAGTYRHGGYDAFYVYDPKRRHIHKASVRDRLLHHAIVRAMEPDWDKSFIYDSWSSRGGKGTHRAVRRLNQLALSLSRNYTRTVWVLQLDIRKFFDSVDHAILIELLRKRTSDERTMQLMEGIVRSYAPGIPLGNLTSQIYANIYLDPLDKFVKHDLRMRGYVRYADDFVLLHPDRDVLVGAIERIRQFLQSALALSLHPRKIKLKTYASGIDFLGYVCFPHHQVIRTKTQRRMFARVRGENIASYRGVLSHCRSHHARHMIECIMISRGGGACKE